MSDRCPMCQSPMVYDEANDGKPGFQCGSDAVQSDECRRIQRIIEERDQLRDEVFRLRAKAAGLKLDLDLERLRCRGCGSTAGNRCPQCTIVCQG